MWYLLRDDWRAGSTPRQSGAMSDLSRLKIKYNNMSVKEASRASKQTWPSRNLSRTAVRKRKVRTQPQPSTLAENVRKVASLRSDLKVDPQYQKVNLNILLSLMSNTPNQCQAWLTRTGGGTSFRAGGRRKCSIIRTEWSSDVKNQQMITDPWWVATFASVWRVKSGSDSSPENFIYLMRAIWFDGSQFPQKPKWILGHPTASFCCL